VVLVDASVSAVSDAHLLSHSLGVNGMMHQHDWTVDTRSLMIVQHKCTTCSDVYLCSHALLSACLHADVISPGYPDQQQQQIS
jgi:hypothetical protein